MIKLQLIKLLALGVCLAAAVPVSATDNPLGNNYRKIMRELGTQRSDLTLLAAHRGVHALYPLEDQYSRTPENSLESLDNADNQGIEIVEVDVRLTQDGVPILSHDSTWGRETNVGAKYSTYKLYNPWDGTGPNPPVNSWSLASVRNPTTGLSLRNSVNWNWSNTNPPTLREAINYIRSKGLGFVLAVDVKDKIALQNAWAEVASMNAYDRVFFKVDAALFPYQRQFYDYFGNLHYVDGRTPDAQFVKIMLVYSTSHIQPGNAFGAGGGEQKIVNSVVDYTVNNNGNFLVGFEFNIKKPGGILSSAISASSRPWGNFNPRREWVDPSNGGPRYFNSDGRCCSALTAYLFNGNPYGLPSDSEDMRPDWGFVLDSTRPHVITTDNVLQLRTELGRRNRRHVEWLRGD